MSAYTDAIAQAKARRDALSSGDAPPNPGGADAHTVGGGTNGTRRRKDFSQIIAEVSADGASTAGPPKGQMEIKQRVLGEPVEMTMKSLFAKADSIDAEHGLVFGWGIICKENGVDYYDVQEDHIPEDAMLKAVAKFAEGARPGKAMHAGPDLGQHLFLFPLTTEIAKAMGIQTEKTGLMLGYKPTPEILAKFKSGEFTGFSIGGERVKDEDQ